MQIDVNFVSIAKSSHALRADGSPSKRQVLPAVELAGDPRGSSRFSEILPDGWSLEVRGASTKLGDSAFGTLKAFQMHCRTGLGSRLAEYQNLPVVSSPQHPKTISIWLAEPANYYFF